MEPSATKIFMIFKDHGYLIVHGEHGYPLLYNRSVDDLKEKMNVLNRLEVVGEWISLR